MKILTFPLFLGMLTPHSPLGVIYQECVGKVGCVGETGSGLAGFKSERVALSLWLWRGTQRRDRDSEKCVILVWAVALPTPTF